MTEPHPFRANAVATQRANHKPSPTTNAWCANRHFSHRRALALSFTWPWSLVFCSSIILQALITSLQVCATSNYSQRRSRSGLSLFMHRPAVWTLIRPCPAFDLALILFSAIILLNVLVWHCVGGQRAPRAAWGDVFITEPIDLGHTCRCIQRWPHHYTSGIHSLLPLPVAATKTKSKQSPDRTEAGEEAVLCGTAASSGILSTFVFPLIAVDTRCTKRGRSRVINLTH